MGEDLFCLSIHVLVASIQSLQRRLHPRCLHSGETKLWEESQFICMNNNNNNNITPVRSFG